MKKIIMLIVLLVVGGGFFYVKYNTMLLDSKESAIIVNKPYHFKEDYENMSNLVKAIDNIFIGEVVKEEGTEPYTGSPNTQYSIRITQNIKGALLGDVVVNQLGGYYKKKGNLYLLSYERTPLLKKGEMYLFFASETKHDYFEMMPKYGSVLLDNEDEKLKQIEGIRKVMGEK